MKVGVIMGGESAERPVSILTGNEILGNLKKEKYEVIPIEINSIYELIDKVKNLDFAFIALHGKFGEDGRVQALLDSMMIPYNGSGILPSALCMDKDMSKKIFLAEGIETPKWLIIKSLDDIDQDKINEIGYPLIVKPNNGGSSLGTFIVKSAGELKKAVLDAFKYDYEIMIEEYIEGEEISCSLLNGKVLPIISIRPNGEFFNYSSKYYDNGTVEEIVNFRSEINNKIIEISEKCWSTFQLQVYARIDMIIKEDHIYVLEINTLPGMTANSLLPKSAKAMEISFSDLLDDIISNSINKL